MLGFRQGWSHVRSRMSHPNIEDEIYRMGLGSIRLESTQQLGEQAPSVAVHWDHRVHLGKIHLGGHLLRGAHPHREDHRVHLGKIHLGGHLLRGDHPHREDHRVHRVHLGKIHLEDHRGHRSDVEHPLKRPGVRWLQPAGPEEKQGILPQIRHLSPSVAALPQGRRRRLMR